MPLTLTFIDDGETPRRSNLQLREVRQAVMATIARNGHPAAEDLDQALRDIPGEPIPRAIVDYVRRFYVRASARARGELSLQRQQRRDLRNIVMYADYCATVEQATRTHESREVKGVAEQATAKRYRVSTKTVRRIVAARTHRT